MATDLNAWRDVLAGVVDCIADENLQRRAWFGLGPEVWSPDEAFNQFFGDAAAEEFFDRDDTGLNEHQLKAGKHLTVLMRELSDQTPDHVKPADLIDDPRWQEVRRAAARFQMLIGRVN